MAVTYSGSLHPALTDPPASLPMTAQILRSHLSQPQQQRYTLVFRNGELLRHQDPLALAQYRCDARLARVEPEGQAQAA